MKLMVGMIWDEVMDLIKEHRLQERTDIALVWGALGYRLRNATYRSMADNSDSLASRDLKQMSDRGLLEARGEKRGRYYVGAPPILEIGKRVMKDMPKPEKDPFAPYEPTLPGLSLMSSAQINFLNLAKLHTKSLER